MSIRLTLGDRSIRCLPRAALLAAALSMAVARHTGAQAPEYQGLNGSISVGSSQWRLDDEKYPGLFAGGLSVGYRFAVPRLAHITVTPHVALTMTRFGGITLGTNEVAFARVEYGLQGAMRVQALRPYLLWRAGKTTVERMVAGEPANYSGTGRGWGAGIEVPLRNRCANAVDIAWRRSTGTLGTVETRSGTVSPGSGDFRSTVFSIGWSGRFRGTQLLFACL